MSQRPIVLLKVLSGPDRGKEYKFSGDRIKIGRHPVQNDFVLSDLYVSSLHGELVWREGKLYYRDLKSRHGSTISFSKPLENGTKRIELKNRKKEEEFEIKCDVHLILGASLLRLSIIQPEKRGNPTKRWSYDLPKTHQPGQSNYVEPTPSLYYYNQEEELVENTQDRKGQNSSSIEYIEGSEEFFSETPAPTYIRWDREEQRVYVEAESGKIVDIREDELPDDSGERTVVDDRLYLMDLGNVKKVATAPMDLDNVKKVATAPMDLGNVKKVATAPIDRFDINRQTLPLRNDDPILEKGKQLDIIFHLAQELNTLTNLEEILDLISEACFEAFEPADFFAVYLTDNDGKLREYYTRLRNRDSESNESIILSRSLLEKVAKSREAILFTRDGGINPTSSIVEGGIWACLSAPLIGHRSLLGVMLVDSRKKGLIFTPLDLNLFTIFASNAAFALERSKLMNNIVEMFEGIVAASITAIEARDPTTAGHSERVARYTLALAEAVNKIETGKLKDLYFTYEELVELRYAALLHDIGKVGVREYILRKGERLLPEQMEVIKNRFEKLKAQYHLFLVKRSCQRFQKFSTDKLFGFFDDIEIEVEKFSKELDEIFEFIQSVNKKERLSRSDLKTLKAIEERRIQVAEGVVVPLLTPQEIQNLKIIYGTLNEDEWENMRSHARLSEEYLQRIPWSQELKRIPCIAGAHHEKLDGSGYPKGLRASEIIPQVRVLTIADIFDALTAWDRPYREAATPYQAIDILYSEAQIGKLDKELVEVFAQKVILPISEKIANIKNGNLSVLPLTSRDPSSYRLIVSDKKKRKKDAIRK